MAVSQRNLTWQERKGESTDQTFRETTTWSGRISTSSTPIGCSIVVLALQWLYVRQLSLLHLVRIHAGLYFACWRAVSLRLLWGVEGRIWGTDEFFFHWSWVWGTADKISKTTIFSRWELEKETTEDALRLFSVGVSWLSLEDIYILKTV
jgi:hypothetical protein